jgi:predicted metal-dependent peptidase
MIANTLREMPLLGYLFSKLKRREDPDIPTMAVTMDNVLIYNSDFIDRMQANPKCINYILLHEWLHIAQAHMPRANDRTKIEFGHDVLTQLQVDPDYMYVLNLAMDAAINQICDKRFGREVVDSFNLIHYNESFATMCDIDPDTIEADREWEYYYNLVPPEVKGDDSHDHTCHFKGAEGNNNDNGEHVRDLINKSIEAQFEYDTENGIGDHDSILSVLPEVFKIALSDQQVWETVISNGFGTTRSRSTKISVRRPSKRYDSPFGKERVKVNLHNVVIVDTSLSCMDLIPKFLSAIERACTKYNSTVDLIFTHINVYNVYKNQQRLNIDLYEIESGATDLTTAQSYIMENYDRNSTVIVITDGYTPWLTKDDGWGFDTRAVYTKDHIKLPEITKLAVITD